MQRPLLAEWQARKAEIEKALAKSKRHNDKAYRDAQAAFVGFLERLKAYRVLDPACGSGNFLYLALKCLKDIEHQVNFEAEALGLERQHDGTGPHNVLGIELNEYAAELARVTVWIGELQWRLDKGYGFKTQPVLEPLDHIETRDAVLGADGREAVWPVADAVVGNPPFVGDKKMRGELGDEYTERLRAAYKGCVPGGADLVCYWFERARAQIAAGALLRAGLVATQSIRAGSSREVLQRVVATTRIFEAWSDEPWVNEGAAVRVSLVAFGKSPQAARLDDVAADAINADLTAGGEFGLDLTSAVQIADNQRCIFQGTKKIGDFDIAGLSARTWLACPNPNGRSNADVLKPSWNGLDLTRRSRNVWIVDFGIAMSEADASLYEKPFAHVVEHVKPERIINRRASRARNWWRHGDAQPAMRSAIAGLPRYVVTPEVSKHRVFVWADGAASPDCKLMVIARADDASFGLVQSRIHEVWSLALGSVHGGGNDGGRPRYTPSTTFETFPFPSALTPTNTAHQRTEALPDGALILADLPPAVREHAAAIARAAKRLTDLRDAWLNPPEWTERMPEVVPPGMDHSPYPDRIVAKPGFEKDLAKRTLTNLYNQRPAWLAQAHNSLDAAVATAYGWADWTPAMADDEILRRLLALNLERAQ